MRSWKLCIEHLETEILMMVVLVNFMYPVFNFLLEQIGGSIKMFK